MIVSGNSLKGLVALGLRSTKRTMCQPLALRMGGLSSPLVMRTTAARISGISCVSGTQPRSPPFAALSLCSELSRAILNVRCPLHPGRDVRSLLRRRHGYLVGLVRAARKSA
jgi:hypothetical protein